MLHLRSALGGFLCPILLLSVSFQSRAQWANVSSDLTDHYANSFTVIGTNLFVGTHGGVFRSTNDGDNWTAVNNGLTTTWVRCLVARDTDLFAGTFGGLFHSTDRGASWATANAGLTSLYVSHLAESNNVLFAETDHGLFRSTDNGSTWTNGLVNPVSGFVTSGPFFFVGGMSVFASSDDGQGWAVLGSTGAYIEALAVAGTNMFAGTGGGLWVSTSSGSSWARIDTGMSNGLVRALAASGPNLFAATWDGVFLFTWNGTAWTQVNTGLKNLYTAALTVSNGYLFAADDNGAGVHRYVLPVVLPIQLASFSVQRTAANSLRVTWSTVSEINNYGFLVQKSTDKQKWETVGDLIRGHGTTIVPQRYDAAFPAAAGSWWVRLVQLDLDGAQTPYAAQLVQMDSPESFALAQNYPNPFNPSTTISYGIPADVHVTLSIYNTLGQQVAALVNEVQVAGNHSVKFDGSGLASGVYVYRMKAGDFVQSRRLLLLR